MPRTADLPLLHIVAEPGASALIEELFGKRGFVVRGFSGHEELSRHMLTGGPKPAAVVIDLALPDGLMSLAALSMESPRPAIVGIVDPANVEEFQPLLDSAFAPPVDPARLYARIVHLVAARVSAKGSNPSLGQAMIPGLVGVVEGNALFHRVAEELQAVVPPVNAGAVLEMVLYDVGSSPCLITAADLAAVVASGRLTEALLTFGDARSIAFVVDQINALLTKMGPPQG